MARALAEGFAWQGEYRPTEKRHWGEPSAFLAPTSFVSFIQNHDHIGNRPSGERIGALASERAVRAIAAIMLLSPQIPLLFMGEEWAAEEPFVFFSDVGEDLADIIREARAAEAQQIPGSHETPPDPMSEKSFTASKLDWAHRNEGAHGKSLSLYRKLIALRKQHIIPRLYGMQGHAGHYEVIGARAFRVWWTLGDGSELSLLANLGPEPLDGIDIWSEGHLWLEGQATDRTLQPWGVVFNLSKAAAI